jgi:peroxiredoxin
MQRRILILPISALVIAGLCVYKWTRSYEKVPVPKPDAQCAPPLFDLPNQNKNSTNVRLGSYLGRHRILLVFFDGEKGAEKDSTLLHIRENYEAIKKTGTVVFGISTAIPQLNRVETRATGSDLSEIRPREPFPFPLLTDLSPACKVHRQWGRYDKTLKRPLQGTFLIDRVGLVACVGRTPKPLFSPQQKIDEIISGR